jgi:hypothetical protein
MGSWSKEVNRRRTPRDWRRRSTTFDNTSLAYLSAFLLVVLYLGRLIVLDPSNPVILIPVLLNGFVINPALYLLLGFALLSGGGDYHA